jgi:site-specific recombinase XerD
MASLQKRNKVYYIVFSKREGEDFEQKKFSLKTKSKREAVKLKIKYEELYENDEIDPFSNWSPKEYEKRLDVKSQPKVVTLKGLTEKFKSDRKNIRQVTIDAYARHFNMLMNRIGETIPVSMITEEDMRSICYQSHLAIKTQHSYITHYSTFFNWLKSNGFIKSNPMDNIKKPKVPENTSEKTINDRQLEKIFKVYRTDIKKKKDLRQISTRAQSRIWFRPIVSLAYYAGLRVKEVVQLKWSEVDLENEFLTITNTKTGSERVVPMRKELIQILKAWEKLDRYECKGLVFPSETGLAANQGMSKGNISKVFRKYVDKAGLPSSINFHGLRHSCGTNLLRMGMDINNVAKMLGHSSLETTRKYEHLNEKDLKNSLKKIENS